MKVKEFLEQMNNWCKEVEPVDKLVISMLDGINNYIIQVILERKTKESYLLKDLNDKWDNVEEVFEFLQGRELRTVFYSYETGSCSVIKTSGKYEYLNNVSI